MSSKFEAQNLHQYITYLGHVRSFIKGAFSGLRQFLATESPLEMMKNAFYFTLKPLFVLTIYDVITWLTSNCKIHILVNISRSNDNKTMKFGQLIKCNMRTIFFEKSFSKYGGKTIGRPFSKNSKLSTYLDQ